MLTKSISSHIYTSKCFMRKNVKCSIKHTIFKYQCFVCFHSQLIVKYLIEVIAGCSDIKDYDEVLNNQLKINL